MVFRGTGHQNYCEAYLIAHAWLLRRTKIIGPDLDPHKVLDVVNRVVAGFFLRAVENDEQLSPVDDDLLKSHQHSVLCGDGFKVASTETMLQFCDCPSLNTATRVSVIWESSVKTLVQQHIVPESSLTGFADDTTYKLVEEHLAAKNGETKKSV